MARDTVSNSFHSSIQQSLQQRREQHSYRSRRIVAGPQGSSIVVDGKSYLSFCSNDYLGLANHPEVIHAFQQAARQYGVGSGAAHLVSGHHTEHHALEEELAAFVQRPRALLFSTGFMANIGTINALLGKTDAIFEDRLNHASLIDAGLSSGAAFQRFQHADISALQNSLAKSTAHKKLIVTDGVFSMDGDIAPLAQLAKCAHENHAWLMVDDAHGIGVIGEQGRGSINHHHLSLQQVPVLMATLGKAFGTFGAFVAGSEELIEYLIQQARTYIYTTALPPAIAAATRKSLQLVQADNWRREKLQLLINKFRQGAEQLGLQLLKSNTPIQPLILGDNQAALAASEALYQQGILVTAIRPPTVPANSARLRITLSAQHQESDIDLLLTHLEQTV